MKRLMLLLLLLVCVGSSFGEDFVEFENSEVPGQTFRIVDIGGVLYYQKDYTTTDLNPTANPSSNPGTTTNSQSVNEPLNSLQYDQVDIHLTEDSFEALKDVRSLSDVNELSLNDPGAAIELNPLGWFNGKDDTLQTYTVSDSQVTQSTITPTSTTSSNTLTGGVEDQTSQNAESPGTSSTSGMTFEIPSQDLLNDDRYELITESGNDDTPDLSYIYDTQTNQRVDGTIISADDLLEETQSSNGRFKVVTGTDANGRYGYIVDTQAGAIVEGSQKFAEAPQMEFSLPSSNAETATTLWVRDEDGEPIQIDSEGDLVEGETNLPENLDVGSLPSVETNHFIDQPDYTFKDAFNFDQLVSEQAETISVPQGVDERDNTIPTGVFTKPDTTSKTTTDDSEVETFNEADAGILALLSNDGAQGPTPESSDVWVKAGSGHTISDVNTDGNKLRFYRDSTGTVVAVQDLSIGAGGAESLIDHPLLNKQVDGVTGVSEDSYMKVNEDEATIYEKSENGYITYERDNSYDGDIFSSDIRGRTYGSGAQEVSIEAIPVDSEAETSNNEADTTSTETDNQGYVVITSNGRREVNLNDDQYGNINHLGAYALTQPGLTNELIFEDNNRVRDQIPLRTTEGYSTADGQLSPGGDQLRTSEDLKLGEDNQYNSKSYLKQDDSVGGSTTVISTVNEREYINSDGDLVNLRSVSTGSGVTEGTITIGRGDNRREISETANSDGTATYSETITLESGNEITVEFTEDAKQNVIERKVDAEVVEKGSLFGKQTCEDCTKEEIEEINKLVDNIKKVRKEEHKAKATDTFARSGTFAQINALVGDALVVSQAWSKITPFMETIGLFEAEDLMAWRNNVDSAFEAVGLTSSFYVKKFCADDLALPDGKNSAFIEMPDGSVRVGASVQSECTEFVPLHLQQYDNATDYTTRYYIVTGLIKNPPIGDGEENSDMRYQITLEGEETVSIFNDTQPLSSGQTFSLTNSNAFRVYTSKVFDKVCLELTNPPEYFGGENRFCNVISCNELDDSADYSSEDFPEIIQTPDGVPTEEVESGTGGSAYNYEAFAE